jgi:hypothetical protein
VPQIYAALTQVVVASPLPEAAWYSAAESAVTAIYALHPAPEHLSAAVLRHLARQAFATAPRAGEEAGAGEDAMDATDGNEAAAAEAAEGEQAPGEEGSEAPPAGGAAAASRSMHAVVPLCRFFFVLGHVALQHLVFVERSAKAVRRMRLDREKKAAEDRSERLAAGRTPGGGWLFGLIVWCGAVECLSDVQLHCLCPSGQVPATYNSHLAACQSTVRPATLPGRLPCLPAHLPCLPCPPACLQVAPRRTTSMPSWGWAAWRPMLSWTL